VNKTLALSLWTLVCVAVACEDSSGGGGEEDEGAVERSNVPARGVLISSLEANPGVAIPIVRDGVWLDGTTRNAPIPRYRNTAFRVYLDVDERNWVERELEGRLTVTQADGTETEYSEVATIRTDSALSSLQSNLLFGVLAEDMQPGAMVQVELFETTESPELYADLPEASSPPRALPEPALIGIQNQNLTLRVVMVPVEYEFGGCQSTPDLSDEATLQPYEDALFQNNPVESVEISVHEPLRIDDLDLSTLDGFYSLLPRIQRLRAAETPEDNVYYYGLFDNCGACISSAEDSVFGGCTLGVAPGRAAADRGSRSFRASIGAHELSGQATGPDTFVHEIGHNQGRGHVACPRASASSPDPFYPYEEGKIGVWGFGVRDFEIRNPSSYSDYMSYCGPAWVSDYQWTATFLRIQELSAWESEATEARVVPNRSSVLVGALNPGTGEASWWTEFGSPEDAPADALQAWSLEFGGPDGSPIYAAAEAVPWTDGAWMTVRAPLPSTFSLQGMESRPSDEVLRMELHGPMGNYTIDPKAITRFDASHELRTP